MSKASKNRIIVAVSLPIPVAESVKKKGEKGFNVSKWFAQHWEEEFMKNEKILALKKELGLLEKAGGITITDADRKWAKRFPGDRLGSQMLPQYTHYTNNVKETSFEVFEEIVKLLKKENKK